MRRLLSFANQGLIEILLTLITCGMSSSQEDGVLTGDFLTGDGEPADESEEIE